MDIPSETLKIVVMMMGLGIIVAIIVFVLQGNTLNIGEALSGFLR